MNNRFKNPYFWTGLVAIIIASSGIEVSELTTWSVLADKLVGIVQNPLTLASVGMAVLGVFVNPTTKGIKD